MISCEVAEHLDEKHARRFVAHLATSGPRVYMTATEPDPSAGPGLYHLNEQPNAYWIALLSERGFMLDEKLTASVRERFTNAGVISYLAKPIIFAKR